MRWKRHPKSHDSILNMEIQHADQTAMLAKKKKPHISSAHPAYSIPIRPWPLHDPHQSILNRALPPSNSLLLLNPLHPPLQIKLEILHIHRRHKQRRIREQIIHLLQRPALGLRLERPEVQRVGEIADNEKQVEAPADALHGDGRDLADHGVEGEGDHDADRDTFGAGAGVEDFGGDDPWGLVSGFALVMVCI